MTELLDARGVAIAPGDVAIYGFSVSRSVAMAEAVVLGVHSRGGERPLVVSLTPSGRVRLRVTRRSYSSGEKPVVDVAADRLVVLKEVDGPLQPGTPEPCFALPSSPKPTQDETARAEIEADMAGRVKDLRSDRITWGEDYFLDLADFHAYTAKRLTELRRKLKELG